MILAGLAAVLGSVTFAADLEAAGWRLWTLSSAPAARFTSPEPGRIDVTAEAAFGLLYRELNDEESARHHLAWRWRVEATIPPTDLARRGADDRPLAVHVSFPDTESGFLSRIGRSIAHTLAGVPLKGMVLTYVWGGAVPRDTLLPNPHLDGQGALIVLRGVTDPTGTWLAERVDFKADFRRAFGRAAPKPTHIAISADTDDGGGRATGAIEGLWFAE
jgi:hypothetical protein